MSIASTVADYIQHNRSLGKRFVAEAAILSAFCRAVGSMPLRNICSGAISRFVHREGTSAETIAKKHRVLACFFRYAVTRGRLKASQMPRLERKRAATSFTPYIFSEARAGWSRSSLHALGGSLRSFFRYAAQQGWCGSSIAVGIGRSLR